jgi:hypothetical protein
MKMQLINGEFTALETLELITQMVQVKIKFLETKIHNSHNEEDIKTKESKIIALQNKVTELRNQLTSKGENSRLIGEFEIS